VEPELKVQASASERFSSLKTKIIVLFVQFAFPTNYIRATGKPNFRLHLLEVFGSGSPRLLSDPDGVRSKSTNFN